MNKLIKQFTAEDWKQYNHKRYELDKDYRLQYQKQYYQQHKIELRKKARNRYRIKCGLKEEK